MVYLSPQTFELIRRAVVPDVACGWIELPNMNDVVFWSEASRKGVAIRIRSGRWPAGKIRSATIPRDCDM